MTASKRWKEFIIWWTTIEPKAHLYPASILAKLVSDKIEELRGQDER